MSDNWHHQLANPSKKELERRRKRQLDDSDFVKPIYKFKDGYRVVELANDACKTREGELMGHCVGDGGYRGKTILSLRDTSNEPHATMEISKKDPFEIVQLQGKANQDVVEKYWPYIREFLRKTDYHLDPYYLKKIGLIEIEGNTYEINHLPDELKVGGNLILSDSPVTHLPNGLTVGGSLYLSNTPIKQLPNGLTVGESLDLRNSKITHLPDDLAVGGDLYLSLTPITHLPDGLKVGGGLDLRYSNITHLPDDLAVGGSLVSRNSKITQLPDGLKVGGGLYLSDTPITHLPDGLTVGGDLDLRNTLITHLPDDLFVRGEVYYDNTGITREEYNRWKSGQR
jgi:hypothetical protein